MPRPARRPLISKAGAGRSEGAGPRAAAPCGTRPAQGAMAPKNLGGFKWGGRPCSSCCRLAGRRDGGGDVAAARRRGGRNGAQMGEYRAAAGQAAGREMPRQGPRGRLWRQGPRAAARYCQKRGISTRRRPDAHAPQSRTRAFTAAIVRGGATVRRFAGHSPIGSVFLAWRRAQGAGCRPSRCGAASAARRPAGRMQPRSMPLSRARAQGPPAALRRAQALQSAADSAGPRRKSKYSIA